MNDVLVTGATGLVGGELLARLVRRRPEARVHCLIRAHDTDALEKRRTALVRWCGLEDEEAKRVHAHAADVTLPDLGLGGARAPLARSVGEIFHAAASTRFDLALEDARAVNVGAAANVLRFAEAALEAGGLRRLHHVSTAFVNGAPESNPPRYRNAYEQSKAETEALLEAAGERVPITRYRPSIIMGDTRTGRTLHFRVLYEPIKWVYTGLTKYIPVGPELRLDVVPVDYVCDALLALADLSKSEGRAYRLTAGPERAISVAEMVRISVDTGNAYHAEIGLGPTPEPELLSPEILQRASGAERERLEKIFGDTVGVVRAYLPYMLEEQLFDDPETRAALRGTGVVCPPGREYFGTLVRYALETRFGERAKA